MFDNVMETSARPMIIDDSDKSEKSSDEETPIKAPPAKRKLGPKPAAEKAPPKRKIVSSDSESSPVKRKVSRGLLEVCK